jgi:hypothetical protein
MNTTRLVCSECLTEACFAGVLMCENARRASVIKRSAPARETAPLVLPADEFDAMKAVMEALTGPDGKPVPYLTGVGHGWHAVSRESLAYLRTGPADSVAFAECGELVRVAPKFGAYNRADVPVSNDPCHICAFTVAAAGGMPALQAEVDRLPAFAADICRAILTEPDWEPRGPASIQLLAKVAAHAPALRLREECADRDCEHEGGICPSDGAVCAACSLLAGDWAGEWQGQLREECTIPAPCAVLLALAKYAGVTGHPQGYASRTGALSALGNMEPLFDITPEGTS